LPAKLLGKIIGRIILLFSKNNSQLFFLFPFYHTGGAEKVHCEIVKCFAAQKPWVFFTGVSADKKFKEEFKKNARCFYLPHLFFYFYPVILAAIINHYKNPTVLGANNSLLYLLTANLKNQVKKIDLIHALDDKNRQIIINYTAAMDQRVVISSNTREELAKLYQKNNLDPKFIKRVAVIENKVKIPESFPAPRNNRRLKALYVGRKSEEKRVYLLENLAKICQDLNLPIDFIFIGYPTADGKIEPNTCFPGLLLNQEEINNYYQISDLLLLSSAREGFPLVIMEAMAYGVVPLATNVGGISLYLKNGYNGFLIDNSPAEIEIINNFLKKIKELIVDRENLKKLSGNCYDYARKNFNSNDFCQKYQQIINN
jgi:glycosyltransferase involved in cell wall biosynthesis